MIAQWESFRIWKLYFYFERQKRRERNILSTGLLPNAHTAMAGPGWSQKLWTQSGSSIGVTESPVTEPSTLYVHFLLHIVKNWGEVLMAQQVNLSKMPVSHIRVPIWVLAAPLESCSLLMSLDRQWKIIQGPGPLSPMCETQMEFLAPALTLGQLTLSLPLGEKTSRWNITSLLSLSFSL